KEHDQKGRASSQAIQHFKVFFSTTRTVGSNRNIHRTVLHNSGCAPFSMRVLQRRMFQRTTKLAVRGVSSEELPASTCYSPGGRCHAFFSSSQVFNPRSS